MKWAYYNEFDPFAAEWLRELIKAGLIADGEVDERDIRDVAPDDLRSFRQVHLFAGIGVWSRALRNAGVADDEAVWTASFPCQPFSAAGKGDGFDDERHLWPYGFWIIENCRPKRIFGEQVASKDGLAWLDLVLSDLEAAGYSAWANDICAAGYGAPHIRQRLYWCADAESAEREFTGRTRDGRARLANGMPRVLPSGDSDHERFETRGCAKPGQSGRADKGFEEVRGLTNGFWKDAEWLLCRDGKYRPVEPLLQPLPDEFAGRMGLRSVPSLGKPEGAEVFFPLIHKGEARAHRLKGYGNAIVSECAEGFIRACIDATK